MFIYLYVYIFIRLWTVILPWYCRQSLELGYTDFTQPEIEQLVEQMGVEYRGDQYHLLKKNCNHFAQAFVEVRGSCSGPYRVSGNKL